MIAIHIICVGLMILFTSTYCSKITKLNRGLVFLKEKEILISGSHWIFTVDFDMLEYRRIVQKYRDAVQEINILETTGLTEGFDTIANDINIIINRSLLIRLRTILD